MPDDAGSPMSGRSTAGVVAFVLLFVSLLVATLVPTNYVVYSPGPTVNLLGKDKTGDFIRVTGAKVYRDKARCGCSPWSRPDRTTRSTWPRR